MAHIYNDHVGRGKIVWGYRIALIKLWFVCLQDTFIDQQSKDSVCKPDWLRNGKQKITFGFRFLFFRVALKRRLYSVYYNCLWRYTAWRYLFQGMTGIERKFPLFCVKGRGVKNVYGVSLFASASRAGSLLKPKHRSLCVSHLITSEVVFHWVKPRLNRRCNHDGRNKNMLRW